MNGDGIKDNSTYHTRFNLNREMISKDSFFWTMFFSGNRNQAAPFIPAIKLIKTRTTVSFFSC